MKYLYFIPQKVKRFIFKTENMDFIFESAMVNSCGVLLCDKQISSPTHSHLVLLRGHCNDKELCGKSFQSKK